jgi:hypothetical protein
MLLDGNAVRIRLAQLRLCLNRTNRLGDANHKFAYPAAYPAVIQIKLIRPARLRQYSPN